EAFTWSYERPAQSAGESSMPDRKAFANTADTSLGFSGGGGDGGGDGGGGSGGGDGGSASGVSVQYLDARADILLIKYKGRTATVPAYPTGSGRYIPAFSPSGSGDGGGDGGGGDNGGGGGSGTFTSPAEGEFTSDYGPRD